MKTFSQYLRDSYIYESADLIHKHISNTDYDDHTVTSHENKHMKSNRPAASVNNTAMHSGYSHMHHITSNEGKYTIIHHSENKDSTKHDPFDGYHKIKGHVKPEHFKRAMNTES